jgi:hypothetical protein
VWTTDLEKKSFAMEEQQRRPRVERKGELRERERVMWDRGKDRGRPTSVVSIGQELYMALLGFEEGYGYSVLFCKL